MSLAEDDPVRDKLLFRALADFSDACDVPELNPMCAYYQLQPDGSAVCAEECKDILGEQLSHVVQRNDLTVSLGDNLFAVRGRSPRPRRRNRDAHPVFDTRLAFLTDRDKSLTNWRLTALLYALSMHFTWSRSAGDDVRDYSFESLRNELSHRDIDVDSMVRQGLYSRVVSQTVLTAVEAWREKDDSKGWYSAADPFLRADDGQDGGQDADHAHQLDRLVLYVVGPWVLHATIEDIADRTFDTTSDPRGGKFPQRDYDAVWLMDRFTRT